jgi:DNA-binding response OmpR family regulator
VAQLLLLTNAPVGPHDVLGALGLLPHAVRMAPAEPSAIVQLPAADAVLVDGRRELVAARNLCRLISETTGLPVLLVLTEGGLTAVTAQWGVHDVILDTAGPAEVTARIRLAMERNRDSAREDAPPAELRVGGLSIDEDTYSARLRGVPLDLTYKEFELLKYLMQHPSRVFSRAQLLQEVWGYDYFGGTRTVDVHVRRLRAKLGVDHELIGTVRNVGYRLVPGADRHGPAPGDEEEESQ